MKYLKLISVLLIATLSLCACGQNSEEKHKGTPIPTKIVPDIQKTVLPTHHETTKPTVATQKPIETPSTYEVLLDTVDVDNATYLIDKVYASNPTNTLISPLSLNFALSMVTEGASGSTKNVLTEYLGSTEYGEYVKNYMQYAEELNQTYESMAGTFKNVFNIANSVWINNESKINESFKNKITSDYQAVVDVLDAEHPDESATKINNWVDEKTNSMIPSIINPMLINRNTQSILVNTVYFESAWKDEWYYDENYVREFTDINGNKKEIALMINNGDAYYENDKATAFSCNYRNGLTFIGILPKSEGDFKVSDLDIQGLLDSKTTEYDVEALMPKLDFDSDISVIKDVLSDLGMEIIFTDDASFDGMIDDYILHIDDIIQKCKIELDEYGTKAAAATAIVMVENAVAIVEEPIIKEVHLDRPFAFMIYDETHNQIVFLGKVVDVS